MASRQQTTRVIVMSSEDNKVPYIVYESSEARHERIEKRLIIALIISVALLFVTNVSWLVYNSQYDYSDETVELKADEGNANYVGKNGDITNGVRESKEETKNQEESKSKGH